MDKTTHWDCITTCAELRKQVAHLTSKLVNAEKLISAQRTHIDRQDDHIHMLYQRLRDRPHHKLFRLARRAAIRLGVL